MHQTLLRKCKAELKETYRERASFLGSSSINRRPKGVWVENSLLKNQLKITFRRRWKIILVDLKDWQWEKLLGQVYSSGSVYGISQLLWAYRIHQGEVEWLFWGEALHGGWDYPIHPEKWNVNTFGIVRWMAKSEPWCLWRSAVLWSVHSRQLHGLCPKQNKVQHSPWLERMENQRLGQNEQSISTWKTKSCQRTRGRWHRKRICSEAVLAETQSFQWLRFLHLYGLF